MNEMKVEKFLNQFIHEFTPPSRHRITTNAKELDEPDDSLSVQVDEKVPSKKPQKIHRIG